MSRHHRSRHRRRRRLASVEDETPYAIIYDFPIDWRLPLVRMIQLGIDMSPYRDLLAEMRHHAVEAALTGSSPCGVWRKL